MTSSVDDPTRPKSQPTEIEIGIHAGPPSPLDDERGQLAYETRVSSLPGLHERPGRGSRGSG